MSTYECDRYRFFLSHIGFVFKFFSLCIFVFLVHRGKLRLGWLSVSFECIVDSQYQIILYCVFNCNTLRDVAASAVSSLK